MIQLNFGKGSEIMNSRDLPPARASNLTPAMIAAGVRELRRCIPMDVASPVLAEEIVVERVVCAVLAPRTDA
jgi:hypothetical protein